MNLDALLNDLNKEQQEAVTHGEGPLLIVAGAGTGKTTVITRRIAWLILSGKCKPEEILALTFTDKAAGEMEERVDRLLPYGYVNLWISTFHAFCDRILKSHALDIGLSNNYKLLDQTALWLLVRKNLDRFHLDYYRPLGNPTACIHALLKHFSRAKDEEVTSEQYLEFAKNCMLDTDTENVDLEKSRELRRIQEVADAYHVYEQLLFENNALDFGGLITYTLKLFRERPARLEQYRKKFKYILVDEFQDTNWAQYELIKLLAESHNNLTVVGDDDQCLPGTTQILLPNKISKPIQEIRIGDAVLTGVGKGHIGISRVEQVIKRRASKEVFTITTKRGFRVSATSEHKFFCYVSNKSDASNFYVYLMFRGGIGWRLGVTQNLSQRLRFERSADSIIGLRAFKSDSEARYYETFWSLFYGIPTVCFKEREGIVIKKEKLFELYKNLDVEKRVQRLAVDLGISLEYSHFRLAAVTRGSSKRIKINIKMCDRTYRSKDHVKKQNELLINPSILHVLSLETSSQEIIKILENSKYRLQKVKKGKRLRITSQDSEKLKKEAEQLKKLTGGFVEVTCAIGRYHFQHLPARIIPASNLLPGHFIPIKLGNNIEYDSIASVTKGKSYQTFYDLEIAKTHNFIANGIIVHNSIYKFRGASVANVLEFKKDFPNSKEIVLVDNFRSSQKILDASYQFIQQNNPNRLEFKYQLPKKLRAFFQKDGDIMPLQCETQEEEVREVVQTIRALKEHDQTLSWADFAILVRSNSIAMPFLSGLQEHGIPYVFLAQKGLYLKPIILDILAYCRVLFNPHESASLYRVFSMSTHTCSTHCLIELSHAAHKAAVSLWEMACKIETLTHIKEDDRKEIFRIVSLIQKHAQSARAAKPVELFLTILKDCGILSLVKQETSESSRESLRYLLQFFGKLKKFQEEFSESRLRDFCELVSLEQEAGDEGSVSQDYESGPDTVKVMTVHASKGLEFEVVFLSNLVDRRFPTIERNDAIQLPLELVKETLLEGDFHLEEERRLFYVGMTRAKSFLYYTWCSEGGGVRKRKPSQFLYELNVLSKEEVEKEKLKTENLPFENIHHVKNPDSVAHQYELSSVLSYSQLTAFQNCPLQYKYAFLLKIPTFGKPSFSFGKTLHGVLQHFFEQARERSRSVQESLFSELQQGYTKTNAPLYPSLDELLKLYETEWIDDWYHSKHQKDEYYQKGKEILKNFWNDFSRNPLLPKYIEQDFILKISEDGLNRLTLKGRIDRIDECGEGQIEIIDYKTGKSKEEKGLTPDDKRQLLLYQLAAEEVLGERVNQLTYYYLEDGSKISFLGSEKDKEKIRKWLHKISTEMAQSDFTATPGWHCKFCDFREICEYRQS